MMTVLPLLLYGFLEFYSRGVSQPQPDSSMKDYKQEINEIKKFNPSIPSQEGSRGSPQ